MCPFQITTLSMKGHKKFIPVTQFCHILPRTKDSIRRRASRSFSMLVA